MDSFEGIIEFNLSRLQNVMGFLQQQNNWGVVLAT
jgi:hypothetical protein